MRYRLDLSRTAVLYRAIANNDRNAMRELLRGLGQVGGVISPAVELAVRDGSEIYAYDLVGLNANFEQYIGESEALDRSDSWAAYGVWIPCKA